jgi:hypothetical protein
MSPSVVARLRKMRMAVAVIKTYSLLMTESFDGVA